ncbi:hypothetical protein CP967_21615 [Streptomyces nitrosporeus]|uniref:DUF3558 domain-containing protein n=1 Tax=Streptomyces nitrosporeus TaxID=28894 RepID=A0A5J6FDV0_9ACTN|nr:hypothetical protein CP967_21615 [Streptomyces nitrosporeus]
MLLIAMGLTACDDVRTDKAPEALPASQVCGGTLSAAGAAALRRIGGQEKYTELEDPGRWSPGTAAKRLEDSADSDYECSLYLEGDDSGTPLMMIGFTARKSHPDPSEAAKDPDHGQVLYPLGVYASVGGDTAASLFFECPTKRSEGGTRYVKASMYTSKGKMKADAGGKDRMAVLNDVSRALAEELGCAAKAKLPAEVPEALAG